MRRRSRRTLLFGGSVPGIFRDGAIVLALAALSLVRWGNAAEQIGMYLPLIRSLAGTWPAPPDAHIALLERMPLWWCRVFAFFEARHALFPALLAGVFLGRVALAASGFALGAAIGGRLPGRVAASAIFVLADPTLLMPAHFYFMEAEPLPSSFALSLVLVALALAARGRSLAAGALLGVAANVHPVQTAVSTPVVLAALLVARGSVARAVALEALLAAPSAIFVLARATGDQGFPRTEAYELIHTVVGGHIFFSGFDKEAWSGFLLLAALALATLPLDSRRRRLHALGAASAVGLLLATLGLALADARILPLVGLKLCFARAALVTKGVSLALLAARVARAPGARAVTLAGLLEAPALVAAGLVALAPRLRRDVLYVVLLLALAGGALDPRLAAVLNGAPSPHAAAIVRGVLVAAALLLPRSLHEGAKRPLWRPLVALVLVVFFHHATVSPVVGYTYGRLTTRASEDPELLRLGEFLATKTPPGARLLAPPEERVLDYLAGRPVVASATYATLAPWDLRAGKEELGRLSLLGYHFGALNNAVAYQDWSGEKIFATARALGATHVILDRRLTARDIPGPVHETAQYRVYEVR